MNMMDEGRRRVRRKQAAQNNQANAHQANGRDAGGAKPPPPDVTPEAPSWPAPPIRTGRPRSVGRAAAGCCDNDLTLTRG